MKKFKLDDRFLKIAIITMTIVTLIFIYLLNEKMKNVNNTNKQLENSGSTFSISAEFSKEGDEFCVFKRQF